MKEKEFFKKVINENIINKDEIKQKILFNQQNNFKRGKNMKKKFAISIISIVAVVVTSLIMMVSIYTPQNPKTINPTQTNDYSKIYEIIENFKTSQNNFSRISGGLFGINDKNYDMAPEMAIDESNSQSYSETNVQTQGMDEGDIVKTDGNYIYKINTKGCFILQVNGGDIELTSSILIENYVPKELYVSDNRLVMVGGIYEQYNYYGPYQIEPMCDCIGYMWYNKTDIRIYDISDKVSPILERHLTIDGTYHTSRIMQENNKLFYMINYSFSYGQEQNYIPKISDSNINNGEETKINSNNIYCYEDISYYSYLIIGQIDLDEPTSSDIKAYLGLGGEIYVSGENIFVATFDSYSTYKTNIFGWTKEDTDMIPQTRIVKIGLDTLNQKASARVDGSIKDRYSLDEYNGYLRIATTVNQYMNDKYSCVFVLDSSLNKVGEIRNIAKGESIYSVRFNGETGSLVTFEQIDPYFNLNLSDPANPTISKGLKEAGVSYYLHYIENTHYTIGIGKMSELIHSPYGEFVEWTGLKVTLYDNSTGEAKNINTVIIPGCCYAELFYNPKAFLYDVEKGIFGFSYESWSYDNSNYFNFQSMNQGFAVFSFDTTAENDADKMTYEKTISNLQSDIDMETYGRNYYYDYLTFITRGIRIGNQIYTISDKYIASYDLENFQEIEVFDLYSIEE